MDKAFNSSRSGADYRYLTKPFSTGELLAHIEALLRRTSKAWSESEAGIFEGGGLRVDLAERDATREQILRDVWNLPRWYKLVGTERVDQ